VPSPLSKLCGPALQHKTSFNQMVVCWTLFISNLRNEPTTLKYFTDWKTKIIKLQCTQYWVYWSQKCMERTTLIQLRSLSSHVSKCSWHWRKWQPCNISSSDEALFHIYGQRTCTKVAKCNLWIAHTRSECMVTFHAGYNLRSCHVFRWYGRC
jgi:hypothetical protein